MTCIFIQISKEAPMFSCGIYHHSFRITDFFWGGKIYIKYGNFQSLCLRF